MTDDTHAPDPATAPDDADTPDTPGSGTPGEPPRRGITRRGWTWIVGGGLVAIVVLVCVVFGAVLVTIRGAVNDSRHQRSAEAASRSDVETACLELEQRLNRLTPPGATGGPAARAKAIRDENVAVRPFLLELERVRAARAGDDRDYLSQEWTDGWRQLVEARATYADALDRASGGGDPAFYLAPRDEESHLVADELVANGTSGCDGALRRLSDPAL